jgi:tight adherence protein C
MPDFSYILIFAAAAACVFGVASLFEKTPAVITIRRGSSSNWLLTNFGSRFRPSEKEQVTNRVWLLQAGFQSPDAAQNYMATRMLLMVTLPLAVCAVLPFAEPDVSVNDTLMFALVAAAVGLLGPLLYVRSRRARNQRAVREGLPDILDLLLVCSEAGLGLDTAILKVGEETAAIHPVISKYLLYMSSELRAGRPRAEAFRGFGDRTGIRETTSMVALLVQSDALGTSMAASLRAFADDMRAHRLLRAEELGQRVTVKLTLILAGCFLPALLIAILTPVVNKILHTSFKALLG